VEDAVPLTASGCQRPLLLSPSMSNAASWAGTAGNKFREVARSTENPTTKALAEGLTALAEAVRDLDQQLDSVKKHVGIVAEGVAHVSTES
jgi:hypothetical protein